MTATKQRAKCKHCRKKYQARPRGLCWVCWSAPAIREQYATRLHFKAEGLGLTTPTKPASVPCKALGGSQEKLEALIRRCAAGENLYHPEDGEPS